MTAGPPVRKHRAPNGALKQALERGILKIAESESTERQTVHYDAPSMSAGDRSP